MPGQIPENLLLKCSGLTGWAPGRGRVDCGLSYDWVTPGVDGTGSLISAAGLERSRVIAATVSEVCTSRNSKDLDSDRNQIRDKRTPEPIKMSTAAPVQGTQNGTQNNGDLFHILSLGRLDPAASGNGTQAAGARSRYRAQGSHALPPADRIAFHQAAEGPHHDPVWGG